MSSDPPKYFGTDNIILNTQFIKSFEREINTRCVNIKVVGSSKGYDYGYRICGKDVEDNEKLWKDIRKLLKISDE